MKEEKDCREKHPIDKRVRRLDVGNSNSGYSGAASELEGEEGELHRDPENQREIDQHHRPVDVWHQLCFVVLLVMMLL